MPVQPLEVTLTLILKKRKIRKFDFSVAKTRYRPGGHVDGSRNMRCQEFRRYIVPFSSRLMPVQSKGSGFAEKNIFSEKSDMVKIGSRHYAKAPPGA